jgi:acyl carrier protein phosphodiesterase
MNRIKRGVGYCTNEDCDEQFKGTFLMNHNSDKFYCPSCRKNGQLQAEFGASCNEHPRYDEVRVEYEYDAREERYKAVAIVRDEGMWGGHWNKYTLRSPLIRTEKRALKVAEAILSNLNQRIGYVDDNGIPRTEEMVISWDSESYSHDLQRMAERIERMNDMTDDYKRAVKS